MPIKDAQNEKVINNANLSVKRSRFQKTYDTLTTFNSGYWFPIFCQEVLPGEQIHNTIKSFTRMLTPAVPVMDDCFLDIAAFYVPCRLCTKEPDDFQRMMGANSEPDAWTSSVGEDADLIESGNTISVNTGSRNYVLPQSLLDYLGIPVAGASSGDLADTIPQATNISVLPINAYTRIWNEWLRDENFIESVDYFDSTTTSVYAFNALCWPMSTASQINGSISTAMWNYFGSARKMRDYFTSCLPSPQKGVVSSIGLAGTAPLVGTAEVIGLDSSHPLSNQLRFGPGYSSSGNTLYDQGVLTIGPGTGDNGTLAYSCFGQFASSAEGNQIPISSTNLGADLTGSSAYADLSEATGVTADEIRLLFGLQNLQQRLALGGSRWNEYLHALYGVQVNPGLVNMSVYLGGFTININTQEVVQTSSTDETSPLGYTGAQCANYGDGSFSAAFQEHGYVMVVATARTRPSYSQGINPMWRRLTFDKFFSPTLSFIGEQPIYKEEILASADNDIAGIPTSSTPIFGYQEAWQSYRQPIRQISGYFRPTAGDSTLSAWTYTEELDGDVSLDASFIRQSSTAIGHTLVDTDTNTQFIGSFAMVCDDITPVPLSSFTGLIDRF